MFIWLADGGCGNGKAIFHNSVFVLHLPIKISLSFLYICKFSLTKITRQLSSHNCTIDNKFHVFNDGNMWAIHPAIEMYLIASFAVVDQKYNYWRFLIVPIYIGPPDLIALAFVLSDRSMLFDRVILWTHLLRHFLDLNCNVSDDYRYLLQ